MSTVSTPRTGQTIVVGIDFGETGERALDRALALAADHPGTALHLVYVIAEAANGSNRARVLEQASKELEDVPQRLRACVAERADREPGLGVVGSLTMHARVGTPVAAIIQLAADVGADLIVVGTHGRTGLKKLTLGSVAQRLAETAPCPVLIARPRDYAGLTASDRPEPVCPDCAAVRASSAGATVWCEYHSRPQVRPHAYGWSESMATGGHDPGLVAS